MVYYFLYKFIDITFQILYFGLFIRVMLSWIPHNADHPIVSIIYRISDPLLRPFQNIVPSGRFGIDLAPIFAFIALGVLKKFIFQIL